MKKLTLTFLFLVAYVFLLVGPVSAGCPISGESLDPSSQSDESLCRSSQSDGSPASISISNRNERPADGNGASPSTEPSIPKLGEFAEMVKNGQAQSILGVYAPTLFALKVIQQPLNNPVFVAETNSSVTQFRLTTQYGTTGLVAHNYLAGALFSHLSLGQEVDLVLGDGGIKSYNISAIRHFQALRPDDPYSPFIDLDHGNVQLSSTEVFNQIYAAGNQVVLLTCIARDGNPSWGRLFVIATPIRSS